MPIVPRTGKFYNPMDYCFREHPAVKGKTFTFQVSWQDEYGITHFWMFRRGQNGKVYSARPSSNFLRKKWLHRMRKRGITSERAEDF
jgi:hypothetical protein